MLPQANSADGFGNFKPARNLSLLGFTMMSLYRFMAAWIRSPHNIWK